MKRDRESREDEGIGCAGCTVCNFNVDITRGQSVLLFRLAKALNLHFRFCGESQACRCRLLKILKSHRVPLWYFIFFGFISVYWSLNVDTSCLFVSSLRSSVFKIWHFWDQFVFIYVSDFNRKKNFI